MKKLFSIALLLLLQACNTQEASNAAGQISSEQCDALGGKLVDGQCQKELSEDEMRKICDSQGLPYVKEFNGCVQK